MRRGGADFFVVAMRRGNARGEKGTGRSRWLGSTGNVKNPIINGPRRPSLGGHEPDDAKVHVRFCEGLERPLMMSSIMPSAKYSCSASRSNLKTKAPRRDATHKRK